LAKFSSEKVEHRVLLEQQIEYAIKNGKPAALKINNLRMKAELAELMEGLKLPQEAFERFAEFERHRQVNVSALVELIKGCGVDGKKVIGEALTQGQFNPHHFEPRRLSGLIKLIEVFGEKSATFKKLLAIETEGLLRDVGTFVGEQGKTVGATNRA